MEIRASNFCLQPERRSAERFTLVLPVETDKGPGITRDVSTSGLYLITDERLVVGDRLNLVVTLPDSGRTFPFKLDLTGHVTRVEDIGRAGGAAISLDEENIHLAPAS